MTFCRELSSLFTVKTLTGMLQEFDRMVDDPDVLYCSLWMTRS
jgi:hypothetical protein